MDVCYCVQSYIWSFFPPLGFVHLSITFSVVYVYINLYLLCKHIKINNSMAQTAFVPRIAKGHTFWQRGCLCMMSNYLVSSLPLMSTIQSSLCWSVWSCYSPKPLSSRLSFSLSFIFFKTIKKIIFALLQDQETLTLIHRTILPLTQSLLYTQLGRK